MTEAAESAKYSIDCEQYILSNDSAGRAFLDVLLEKQKSGVKVRLHCDAVGSYSLYKSNIPTKLREAGAEVRFFNPIKPWRIGTFTSWFFRTHRKILIVDSRIGFTGGVGFDDSFTDWRDTHMQFEGDFLLDEMKDAFDKLWELSEHGDVIYRFRSLRSEKVSHRFVTNAPFFKKRFLYYQLVKAMRSAKSRIYLTSAYFVPDARVLRTLILASRRGVDVKIIVPNKSDVKIADIGRNSFYDRLLKAGVKIHHYTPSIIHAKTVVVDDSFVSLGSFNFDNLSFSYNYEANVVSIDKSLVSDLAAVFRKDLAQSTEITLPEWQKRPLLAKLKERLVSPLRRLL